MIDAFAQPQLSSFGVPMHLVKNLIKNKETASTLLLIVGEVLSAVIGTRKGRNKTRALIRNYPPILVFDYRKLY